MQRVVGAPRRLAAALRSHLVCAQKVLGVEAYDVAVTFVTSDRMQHMNRVHRNVNAPTDVLAFPFHEAVEPGVLPEIELDDERDLGDIFLALDVIEAQKTSKLTLQDEVKVVVTHGLCHLLGYDHDTEHNAKQAGAKP